MEGIEACVENVDDTVMPELSSQLITMIKKAVGLPTKVQYTCICVTNANAVNLLCLPRSDF